MFRQKCLTIFCSVISIGICAEAAAGALNIANNSGRVISFKFQSNCKIMIPGRTMMIYPEASLRDACSFSPSNCASFMYNSSDCSGLLISKINFDVNYGVRGIYTQLGNWSVDANQFNLFITGPAV